MRGSGWTWMKGMGRKVEDRAPSTWITIGISIALAQ